VILNDIHIDILILRPVKIIIIFLKLIFTLPIGDRNR